MNAMIKKLSSRKLWVAIAGVATGIAMAMGVHASDITTVAGAVTAIVSVVTYVRTEGKIDAEGVKKAAESTQNVAEVLNQADDTGVAVHGNS